MSSLERAIRILQCLSSSSPRLRVSDVSEQLGLPKSTVSRVLRTLGDGGLLQKNAESRQYTAGPLAQRLGSLYLSEHSLINRIDDAVAKLVVRYGFVGYVGVLNGADVVILRHRFGSYPVRYFVEVGTRFPATETAIGIALMACTADRHRLPVLKRNGASRATLPSRSLSATMDKWRRDRSIEVACTSVPGISAIGSAIDAAQAHDPAIGFSISFPDSAADESLRREMAADIADTSRRLAGEDPALAVLRSTPMKRSHARAKA